MARLLQILSEEDILGYRKGKWQVLQPLPVPSKPRPEIESLGLSQQAEWQLLQRCGSQLGPVLRGAADPLQLVFPSGDLSVTAQLYRDSPEAKAFNTLVQQVVAAALANAPRDRGLRILEIGAGTGGTTSYLLPYLPEERTRYCFTDLGAMFTQKAQERFRDYSFVEYGTLDIEKDPTEQGFEANQQDLVIAANVLHATRELKQTLKHVKQLLAPGGLLVLLEGTRRQRWIDLIFGLLDGWWRFADLELRSEHPLLKVEQWRSLLQENGFSSVAVLPGVEGSWEMGQATIIAQAGVSPEEKSSSSGGWLVLADRQGVAQGLAERLQERGEVFTLVEIGQQTQLEGEILTLNPQDAKGYQQLLVSVEARSGALQSVVHCWGLDGPDAVEMDSEALSEGSQLGWGTLLYLVQALVGQNQSQPPRLWIVTQGAQPAGPGRVNLSGVSQSSLWGMGKVISQEHPELGCTLTDLDADAGTAERVTSLWAEVYSGDREDQVALRQEERYVARLVGSSQLDEVPEVRSSTSGMPLLASRLELRGGRYPR